MLFLLGCSWAPDPSRVPCAFDNFCPPASYCDVTGGFCTAGERPVGNDDGGDDDAGDDDSSDDDSGDDDSSDDDSGDDDSSDDDSGDDDSGDDDSGDDDSGDDDSGDDDSGDDDTVQPADPSALANQNFCFEWSSATLTNDPLGLLSEQMKPYPLVLHFNGVTPPGLDTDAIDGGDTCAPNPVGLGYGLGTFPGSWDVTVPDGRFALGPLPSIPVAASAGTGIIYQAQVYGTWDEAGNRFVDGRVTGQLDITEALAFFGVPCGNLPDCSPCPGQPSRDCMTVDAFGATWQHAGQGGF